jgi:hypothetical protein
MLEMEIFFLLIVIAVIVYRLNRAKILGGIGESRVSSKLQWLPDGYHQLDDVYLVFGNRYAQIDHVIVSRYGIFVIETKNYSGWIFGSDSSEYWTQNLYGEKYELYNPLKQNESHIKTLQSLLKIPYDKFISIVVFTGDATLKFRSQGIVIKRSELNRTILSYETPILSEDQVRSISEMIARLSSNNADLRKRHIQRVKEGREIKKTLLSSGICPRCRGKLILRKGKFGSFYGCSNFPQCRYTVKNLRN